MSNDIFDTPDPASPVQPPSPPPAELGADGTLPLDLYAERAYLAYAMSVVKSRALPQVEDGLKPVQRRILYAMSEMRLSPGAKHVKSARVVGDVIGKYHPHGDSSVYDAMVRVAQDFSLRYPLVDGQGNFGSRDGDSAAAMRYTECRLTPIAELLLSEIDRGTVDFVPNYDGAFEEPQLLPARLPFVLLNGASGIAVGMATEIPPHNLREVAEATCHLIRHPEAGLNDILPLLPGPDFPGGGQLISSPDAIRDAYAGGRGSLRVRARWHFEELARGQWRVIVDQLPHGVSAAGVLSEIETLTNPQPRTGKKELSQEQKNLKQLVLGALDSIRDESSDKAPVRIVLEPKSSRQNRDEFMAVLLAHTSLETSVSVNMTMIGRDGRPQQKNLVQILREWIDFRYVTVERRTRHRLDEVDRRIHILEGRMIAFLHIEEVIRVIRESDEPKPALIAAFGLTDIQAEDILEIRLRQLARLEGFKIEKELAELREERDGLQHLLDSRPAMTRLILKEITDDAKKYGDDRRTLIEAVAAVAPAEISVPDEPITVILSRNGWIRSRQGHGIDPAGITYKAGDFAFALLETRTTWPLVVIDTHGRAYTIKAAELPGGRGDGVPIATLADFQDGGKPAQVLADAPDTRYFFANSGSYGFICTLADATSRQRAGKAFMALEKGETVLTPAKVHGEWIAAASEGGRVLIFPRAEMKVQAGGRGVIVMGMDEGETLCAVAVPADDAVLTVEGIGRGSKPASVTLKPAQREGLRHRRARKGAPLAIRLKPERMY
ncbi:DNA topoisomerase IV subunit A [Parazoarcus communis]|uniref:DNA topoisomerase 4 subunit A n=1 Tax=Parazoarcus communis SWub3 = DSM 12120 TaxID=1121029 RepID=A0A323UZM4_9RHOO|nr:DNA topoisomerase IV subunit A [Parazoarcus communis]NMG70416.1 DNA topoisomerase IV subunit A [Parazoarcus communis SWub3 = DSM 12120]PZA17160.1 DNA topoisomerase IV subunit A [Azoarcus communis] [Parazoarcus communis SWub3 = DSM 12120]